MKKALDFSDVLIVPKPTVLESRNLVNLHRTFNFKYSKHESTIVPIMAANMDMVGTFDVLKTMVKNNMFVCLHKFIPFEEFEKNKAFLQSCKNNFAISIGCRDVDFMTMKYFYRTIKPKFVCIDVANGYMSKLCTFCAKIREHFPDVVIIAGNVCTPIGVENLILEGKVDIVKCGIGGGSACTTRIKTGIGYPQFSCALECAKKAHELGGMIISDGGITCPGDLSKAFGVGSDFVMIGGQFAGHDQNPGDIIEDENGKKWKEFYGMSSSHAMHKNYGGKDSYRASEGRHMKIPYKGDLNNTIEDFLGGLRSTCTYVNCKNLQNLESTVEFIEVNNQFNRSLI